MLFVTYSCSFTSILCGFPAGPRPTRRRIYDDFTVLADFVFTTVQLFFSGILSKSGSIAIPTAPSGIEKKQNSLRI